MIKITTKKAAICPGKNCDGCLHKDSHTSASYFVDCRTYAHPHSITEGGIIMSVIKTSTPTKDGRQWQFRVSYKGHDGKHHTHASKLYKTKTEAKAEEAKYLAEDFRTNATAATIQDLYDGYLSLKEKEIKPQSVQKIKDIYQHIGPAIGSMRADKITVPEYEKFKQSIRDKGYSVCYCNKIHRLVKSILKYGQKYYGIAFLILYYIRLSENADK